MASSAVGMLFVYLIIMAFVIAIPILIVVALVYLIKHLKNKTE